MPGPSRPCPRGSVGSSGALPVPIREPGRRDRVGISGGSEAQIDFDKRGPEAASWRMQIIQRLRGKTRCDSECRRGGRGCDTLSHPLPAAAALSPRPRRPPGTKRGGKARGSPKARLGGDKRGFGRGMEPPEPSEVAAGPWMVRVLRSSCAAPGRLGGHPEHPSSSQFIPGLHLAPWRWAECGIKLGAVWELITEIRIWKAPPEVVFPI